MDPYKELVHGGDLTSWHEENPGKNVIDLSANISPLGFPSQTINAYTDCFNEVAHYPDPQCRELREALSEFEDVSKDWILCGAGASELMYRLTYALRPKRALLLSPTFAEYELALRAAGCVGIGYHDLRPERGFLPDDRILTQVKGCELVMICNPNNPTGALAPVELLRELAHVCRRNGAVLMMDECFIEFLPEPEAHTLKDELGGNENLLILRAFTKIFAMPGLRLGHALCSNPGLLRKMDEAGPTWSVSVPAQRCGIAACKETGYLKRVRSIVTEQRQILEKVLSDCGAKVFPGSANYIFFHSKVTDLAQRMSRLGILIRDCSNYRGLEAGYYRVAVGTPEQNPILTDVLRQCLT